MRNLWIFDCFGVVLHGVCPAFLGLHFDKEEAANIRNAIFPKADRGEIDFEEVMNRLAYAADIPVGKAKEEWEGLVQVNEDVIEAIRKLKEKGDDVVMLSNIMEGFLERTLSKLGIAELFERIYPSYRYRLAKPDKALFEIVLSEKGKDYRNIYFVDDDPKNFLYVRELGITPILFQGDATVLPLG